MEQMKTRKVVALDCLIFLALISACQARAFEDSRTWKEAGAHGSFFLNLIKKLNSSTAFDKFSLRYNEDPESFNISIKDVDEDINMDGNGNKLSSEINKTLESEEFDDSSDEEVKTKGQVGSVPPSMETDEARTGDEPAEQNDLNFTDFSHNVWMPNDETDVYLKPVTFLTGRWPDDITDGIRSTAVPNIGHATTAVRTDPYLTTTGPDNSSRPQESDTSNIIDRQEPTTSATKMAPMNVTDAMPVNEIASKSDPVLHTNTDSKTKHLSKLQNNIIKEIVQLGQNKNLTKPSNSSEVIEHDLNSDPPKNSNISILQATESSNLKTNESTTTAIVNNSEGEMTTKHKMTPENATENENNTSVANTEESSSTSPVQLTLTTTTKMNPNSKATSAMNRKNKATHAPTLATRAVTKRYENNIAHPNSVTSSSSTKYITKETPIGPTNTESAEFDTVEKSESNVTATGSLEKGEYQKSTVPNASVYNKRSGVSTSSDQTTIMVTLSKRIDTTVTENSKTEEKHKMTITKGISRAVTENVKEPEILMMNPTEGSATPVTENTKVTGTPVTEQTKGPATTVTENTKETGTPVTEQTKGPATIVTGKTKETGTPVTEQTKGPGTAATGENPSTFIFSTSTPTTVTNRTEGTRSTIISSSTTPLTITTRIGETLSTIISSQTTRSTITTTTGETPSTIISSQSAPSTITTRSEETPSAIIPSPSTPPTPSTMLTPSNEQTKAIAKLPLSAILENKIEIEKTASTTISHLSTEFATEIPEDDHKATILATEKDISKSDSNLKIPSLTTEEEERRTSSPSNLLSLSTSAIQNWRGKTTFTEKVSLTTTLVTEEGIEITASPVGPIASRVFATEDNVHETESTVKAPSTTRLTPEQDFDKTSLTVQTEGKNKVESTSSATSQTEKDYNQTPSVLGRFSSTTEETRKEGEVTGHAMFSPPSTSFRTGNENYSPVLSFWPVTKLPDILKSDTTSTTPSSTTLNSQEENEDTKSSMASILSSSSEAKAKPFRWPSPPTTPETRETTPASTLSSATALQAANDVTTSSPMPSETLKDEETVKDGRFSFAKSEKTGKNKETNPTVLYSSSAALETDKKGQETSPAVTPSVSSRLSTTTETTSENEVEDWATQYLTLSSSRDLDSNKNEKTTLATPSSSPTRLELGRVIKQNVSSVSSPLSTRSETGIGEVTTLSSAPFSFTILDGLNGKEINPAASFSFSTTKAMDEETATTGTEVTEQIIPVTTPTSTLPASEHDVAAPSIVFPSFVTLKSGSGEDDSKAMPSTSLTFLQNEVRDKETTPSFTYSSSRALVSVKEDGNVPPMTSSSLMASENMRGEEASLPGNNFASTAAKTGTGERSIQVVTFATSMALEIVKGQKTTPPSRTSSSTTLEPTTKPETTISKETTQALTPSSSTTLEFTTMLETQTSKETTPTLTSSSSTTLEPATTLEIQASKETTQALTSSSSTTLKPATTLETQASKETTPTLTSSSSTTLEPATMLETQASKETTPTLTSFSSTTLEPATTLETQASKETTPALTPSSSTTLEFTTMLETQTSKETTPTLTPSSSTTLEPATQLETQASKETNPALTSSSSTTLKPAKMLETQASKETTPTLTSSSSTTLEAATQLETQARKETTQALTPSSSTPLEPATMLETQASKETNPALTPSSSTTLEPATMLETRANLKSAKAEALESSLKSSLSTILETETSKAANPAKITPALSTLETGKAAEIFPDTLSSLFTTIKAVEDKQTDTNEITYSSTLLATEKSKAATPGLISSSLFTLVADGENGTIPAATASSSTTIKTRKSKQATPSVTTLSIPLETEGEAVETTPSVTTSSIPLETEGEAVETPPSTQGEAVETTPSVTTSSIPLETEEVVDTASGVTILSSTTSQTGKREETIPATLHTLSSTFEAEKKEEKTSMIISSPFKTLDTKLEERTTSTVDTSASSSFSHTEASGGKGASLLTTLRAEMGGEETMSAVPTPSSTKGQAQKEEGITSFASSANSPKTLEAEEEDKDTLSTIPTFSGVETEYGVKEAASTVSSTIPPTFTTEDTVEKQSSTRAAHSSLKLENNSEHEDKDTSTTVKPFLWDTGKADEREVPAASLSPTTSPFETRGKDASTSDFELLISAKSIEAVVTPGLSPSIGAGGEGSSQTVPSTASSQPSLAVSKLTTLISTAAMNVSPSASSPRASVAGVAKQETRTKSPSYSMPSTEETKVQSFSTNRVEITDTQVQGLSSNRVEITENPRTKGEHKRSEFPIFTGVMSHIPGSSIDVFTNVAPTTMPSPSKVPFVHTFTATASRQRKQITSPASPLPKGTVSTETETRLHNLDLINLITVLGALVDPSSIANFRGLCTFSLTSNNREENLLATLKDLENSKMIRVSLRQKFENYVKLSGLNPLLWGKVFSLASQYQCMKNLQHTLLQSPYYPGLWAANNPNPWFFDIPVSQLPNIPGGTQGNIPQTNDANQVSPNTAEPSPQPQPSRINSDAYLQGYLASRRRFLQRHREYPVYPGEYLNIPGLKNYYYINGPVTFNNAGNVNSKQNYVRPFETFPFNSDYGLEPSKDRVPNNLDRSLHHE
ncbi:hypothetical protein PoB_004257900 [Plakobranchus ocellatus]|uniref:Uncharacterized protein n=1 Tax=Plakobranchus ocellatus TaxID=259542 RepID=A0AAV4BBG7_9GAST|nr:hypothetical protein PoB_004257900 [Plakobranchus ocellatus]